MASGSRIARMLLLLLLPPPSVVVVAEWIGRSLKLKVGCQLAEKAGT